MCAPTNLGLAVAGQGGVVIPLLRGADQIGDLGVAFLKLLFACHWIIMADCRRRFRRLFLCPEAGEVGLKLRAWDFGIAAGPNHRAVLYYR